MERDEQNNVMNYYDKMGKLVDKVNYDNNGRTSSVSWISPEYYIIGGDYSYVLKENEWNNIGVFCKNHDLIKKWKGDVVLGDKVVKNRYIFCLKTDKQEYIYVSLNINNGKIKEISAKEYQKLYVTEDVKKDNPSKQEGRDKEIFLGQEKNITLYYSNDSWKLEDEQGNSLYDERYYECYQHDGCYFLLNENNELCMIDRNGKMLIDYGIISYQNEKGYYDGMELNDDNCLVGDDGVCIVKESEGNNNVYFYSPQE